MRDEWTQEYVKYSNEVLKEKILEEINSMTVSDFQNTLEDYGFDDLNDTLDSALGECMKALVNAIFEERSK
jgi:hypothetical protein